MMWPWYTKNMKTNDLPKEKELPQVKHERIPGTKVETVKITDSQGKEHNAREETYTEKEIPNTHLTQIAPMFYYCTDNNKILMIPFSVQFTVFEFLKLAATMSGNLEEMLNKAKQEAEQRQKDAAELKKTD
jgi:hypothetical protein